MFAILENLGTPELILCGIAALLVFGKRLPEVAAQAGATLSKFRRNLDGAIEESGVENEIKKIKDALPHDLSVRDVARAATRKVEDRMRQLNAEAEKIEREVKESIKSATETPAPETEATPPKTEGVDPAQGFGTSGTVPRE